jgi:predicted dehydrogenase
LNPVIKGEDCGLMILEHENGCLAQWDANRYNEPVKGVNARYTFGEMLVEGSKGSLRLALDGTITLQQLGEDPVAVDYHHENRDFAGDCVYFCQRHFIDRVLDGKPFETSGDAYLKTLAVQQAVYQSADSGQTIPVG